jgi:hypothetical protein
MAGWAIDAMTIETNKIKIIKGKLAAAAAKSAGECFAINGLVIHIGFSLD